MKYLVGLLVDSQRGRFCSISYFIGSSTKWNFFAKLKEIRYLHIFFITQAVGDISFGAFSFHEINSIRELRRRWNLSVALIKGEVEITLFP